MRTPNVLFIVWDACRLDAAIEHAPTLSALADDNLWFENAIAPAGYSLPSHVSLFTGQYPHEHGSYVQGQMVGSLPLLADLGKRGYTRYGVSANGFASSMYGFDREFDRFYNTQAQMVYPEALDVHRYVGRRRAATDEEFGASDIDATDLLGEALRNSHPMKSLANTGSAALTEIVRRFPSLQRMPHRRFSAYSEFSYSPEKNTRVIESILDREASSDSPFFVFTNYMDTHHPYAPPERYQRECVGRTVPYRDLASLAERTHPWEFIAAVERGEQPLTDAALETVRDLYAGEVRTADEHLGRLLRALDARGLREETLVVVTADHGENLGETDRMGETRMGHALSSSDHLLRVPLLVAHPDLDGDRVAEYVSLKDLRGLLADPTSLLDTGGADRNAILPADGVVSSQVPTTPDSELGKRYPELGHLLGRHRSIAYADGYKVVAISSDEERAWRGEEEIDPADAPAACVEECRDNLATLMRSTGDMGDLSDVDHAHLEALGYL